MVHVADEDPVSAGARRLHLSMAAQAKVGIAGHEHLAVDRAMRIVADGAAFAQRFMLENNGPRLLTMTLRAGFVVPRHSQAARGFENITAMRVMTLDAIHAAFNHRMMLRKMELGLALQVALKADRWVLAPIDDELAAPAPRFDMFAAGAVAGFAAGLAGEFGALKMESSVRAGGEYPGDIGVTLVAGLVAGVSGARNVRRRHNRSRDGGAGIQKECRKAHGTESGRDNYGSLRFQLFLGFGVWSFSGACPESFRGSDLVFGASERLVTAAALRISSTMASERFPLVGKAICK